MPYKVELVPDEPIVIVTLSEPFDWEKDIRATTARVADLTRHMDGPIYRISNMKQVSLDFSEVVTALASATRVEEGGLNDPRFRVVFISQEALIDLAEFGARSASQEQYGVAEPIKVFTDLDEALRHIRAELKTDRPSV
jgi:hypothetical protein